MLPRYSDNNSKFRRDKTSSSSSRVKAFLISLLVLIVTTISYFIIHSTSTNILSSTINLPSKLKTRIYDQPDQQFNYNEYATNSKNLIVVACHSILNPLILPTYNTETTSLTENLWFLLPYQKTQSLPLSIDLHIKAGIKQAALDPDSLLVFSGGMTRKETGQYMSEGGSYSLYADLFGLWDGVIDGEGTGEKLNDSVIKSIRSRTTTETNALDSYQNLIFSIARFHQVTGNYPEKITIVSFTFKEERFVTLHAKAIRFPRDRISFIGVDPPAETVGFNILEAKEGEKINAYSLFLSDLYGCHEPALQNKRLGRDPFYKARTGNLINTGGYESSSAEIGGLLGFCGPEVYDGDLPF